MSEESEKTGPTIRLLFGLVRGGHIRSLTSLQFRIWVVLLSHADRRTAVAWPSAASIATAIGSTRAHVTKGLSDLEKMGFIQTVANAAGGHGRSARRRVILPESASGAGALPADELPPNDDESAPEMEALCDGGSAPITEALEEKEAPPNRDKKRPRNCKEAPPKSSRSAPVAEAQTGYNNPELSNNRGGCAADVVVGLLTAEGIKRAVAADLAGKHDEARIRQVIEDSRKQRGVANRAGWIVTALEENYAPAPTPEELQRQADDEANEKARRAYEQEKALRDEREKQWQREAMPGKRKAELAEELRKQLGFGKPAPKPASVADDEILPDAAIEPLPPDPAFERLVAEKSKATTKPHVEHKPHAIIAATEAK